MNLNDFSSYHCRDLADGRHACVVPLTFGRARIVVAARMVHFVVDDGW